MPLTNESSDTELVVALRAGDNRAFTQVYRKGYSLVEALITRNGGISDDAQDVFQEVLFIVVKRLREPGFSLSCALNTYLYAVARNIWRDRLRGKKHSVEFKDTLHDFEDPTESETNAKRLFEQRHSTVKTLLEQLSEKCRDIIMAFYYEKKSMRDISEATGLAEDGIRVQKHRCMSYLKTKMEAHPDFTHLKNDEQ